MSKKRIHTIRELAEIAGVSHMTVSRAFRNHPSVKAETRERILALAKEYNFEPHPVLSMAMAIRANLRDPSGQPHATLAWVHSNAQEDDWATRPYLKPYLDGVRQRAADLGFGLDTFWIGKGGLSPSRLCDILSARGISGCVVAPPPGNLKHLRLRWNELPWVTFHHDSWRPLLHRVATDAAFNLGKALRELRRMGYRRIGLALSESLDAKTGFSYQGRYLVACRRYPELDWPPPLLFPFAEIRKAAPLLKTWLETYKPDVLVCEDVNTLDLLREWGYSVPDDLALVHLAVGPDTPDWSGMKIDGALVGAACVDLLLSQIQHNQRGIPDNAYEMLLRSRWVNGKTTLKRSG
jgi:LacI family transcriptional regulator